MKKSLKFVCLILSAIMLLIFSACTPQKSAVDFYYFNTQITVFTHGSTLNDKTTDQIKNLFSSLENEFALDGENSFTALFNNASVGDKIPLSKTAAKLFDSAIECYNFTDGKFNPAVFPLVELWEFYPNYPVLNFNPPTREEIDLTLLNYSTDFTALGYKKDSAELIKSINSKIDFGGILKGYALDECAKILKENGHTAGYVSIGSSSVYILSADTLGVKNPKNNQTLLLSVNVKGQNNLSVSTSGDYEKTYTYGDKIYSHIINAQTGMPADTGILSATLISDTLSGEMLDGLSTALCLCSFGAKNPDNELIKLLNKITKKDNTCQFFVAIDSNENKILLTNKKQGEDFTLHDNEYTVVNI